MQECDEYAQMPMTRRAFLQGMAGFALTFGIASCSAANNPPPVTTTATSSPLTPSPSPTSGPGARLFTYTGHYKPVNSVAWSPDGKYIVTGAEDKTVHLWDAATGKHILTYSGHTDRVNTVAWSPNSMRVASGSGGELASSSTEDTSVQIWVA